MKAYKIEVLALDFGDIGIEGVKSELENSRHINTRVKKVTTRDIGEWDDDHPLNKNATCEEAYKDIFDERFYYFEDGDPNEEAMLAYLLDEGVLFPNHREYQDGHLTGSVKKFGPTVVLFVLLNDVFVPASDAEDIELGEVPALFDLHLKHGWMGTVIWAAKKIGMQPRSRIKKQMEEAGCWSEDLEKLKSNNC